MSALLHESKLSPSLWKKEAHLVQGLFDEEIDRRGLRHADLVPVRVRSGEDSRLLHSGRGNTVSNNGLSHSLFPSSGLTISGAKPSP